MFTLVLSGWVALGLWWEVLMTFPGCRWGAALQELSGSKASQGACPWPDSLGSYALTQLQRPQT